MINTMEYLMEPDPPRHPPYTPLRGLLKVELPERRRGSATHWLLAGGATMVWLVVVLAWLG